MHLGPIHFQSLCIYPLSLQPPPENIIKFKGEKKRKTLIMEVAM